MKRIISLILLSAICLSTCLTLGSCGIIENLFGTRTTVTAEEWEKNMNADNFTLEFTQYSATGDREVTDHRFGYSTSEAFYAIMKYENKEDLEIYHEFEKDGSYREIKKDESGVWVASGIKKETTPMNKLGTFCALFDQFANTDYESYIYDEETQAYLYELTSENGVQLRNWIYFENGTIVRCDTELVSQAMRMSWTISFSNIGTTVVTLPKYTILEE